MSILSASPSASGSFSRAAISHSSTSSTRISAVSRPFRFGWSARECSCGATRFNVRTMAELVEDKQSMRRMSAPERTAVLASDLAVDDNVEHSTTFLDARSEEDLLTGIRKEILAGRLPSNIAVRMEEIYHNYRDAVVQSGNPNARETTLSNMAFAFDRILLDVEDPFTFSSHHKAIRKPFDYYTFGQNYIRPLIDFRRSYIGNISLFHAMEAQLQKGHNVILISNHQTEADPVIIALLLERTNPNICQKMTYVAGDRVVTDPVCKPFSMGRNLVCVYSKKHMHDIPELAEMKWRANTHSLKEMALLLRTGAQIIWIAPSGGRDRPDPSTGDWYPAPFDVSSADNIRRLSDHSRVQGHIYPLALLCYNIMPPPPEVEKEIGERRMISYHGLGLSVSQEINFSEVASGIDSPEEAKLIFSQALYDSVCEQYNVLESAVHGNQGLNASNAIVSLSQPWK